MPSVYTTSPSRPDCVMVTWGKAGPQGGVRVVVVVTLYKRKIAREGAKTRMTRNVLPGSAGILPAPPYCPSHQRET